MNYSLERIVSNSSINKEVTAMRKSQLPYLIDLIDDTSEEVRTIVLKELNDYGLSLEEDLQTLSDSIDKDKVNLIRPIIEQNRRITFKANWKIWNQLHDELEQLEYVMQMVVYYQWGSDKASLLSGLIDKLADEFIALSPRRTEVELAEHLFLLYGITGAGDEYFNPFHLNLLYVAEEKKESLSVLLFSIFLSESDSDSK